MYATVAILPLHSQALKNLLRGLCEIMDLGWIRSNEDGDSFRIVELEFDTCTPAFVSTILRGLDNWEPFSLPVLAEVLETDCDVLRQAITAPIPERPSITWCVQRYLMYFPGIGKDYWAAEGRCCGTSLDFLAFLQRYNAVSAEQIANGYARVAMEHRSNPKYATRTSLQKFTPW